MRHIIAEGIRFGHKISVEVKGDTFLFNGKPNEIEMKFLDADLQMKPVYPGAYVPTDAYEDANIYNVLKYHYFDDDPDIQAEGLAPIESEEGTVY